MITRFLVAATVVVMVQAELTSTELSTPFIKNDTATPQTTNQGLENLTSSTDSDVGANGRSLKMSKEEDSSCLKSLNITCSSSMYRTYDGSCNNKAHPSWGQKGQPYRRVMFPAYNDGVKSPRVRKDGSNLPNPRLVSSVLSPNLTTSPEKISDLTYMVMQWGQFLTNDITLKTVSKTSDNKGPECCGEDRPTPLCMAIAIPDRDPLSQSGQTCMEFSRSKLSVNENCPKVPANQESSVTSFLDLSTIYGSDEDRADNLRSAQLTGQLDVSTSQHGDVLPLLNNNMKVSPACQSPPCFITGDVRINQQAALTSLHVLMIREHNRVATALSALNSNWDDEKVYQESRRILIAELQHITYNEYLPSILGSKLMDKFKLSLLSDGYYRNYEPFTNPTVHNAFSTAAYRFGHSLINDNFHRYDQDYQRLDDLVLGDGFFNISLVRDVKHGAEFLLYGLVTQTPSKVDTLFSREVTQRLFHILGNDKGLDLFATNIQRGRDHGIPPYNEWRQWCELEKLRNFTEVNNPGQTWIWKEIENLYGDIDEVDLYVGGVAEPPEDGALMGQTFACIIGRQFLRLRRGDRFWYENGDKLHSFTPDQLAEIRKITLARLMCDNMNGIKTIQPHVMKSPKLKNNHRMKCQDIEEGLDLSLWTNNQ